MSDIPAFNYAAVPISFWLLFAAILSFWLSPWRHSWAVLFAAAITGGFIQGYLEWPALFIIPLAGLTCFWMGQKLFEGNYYLQLRNSRPQLEKALTIGANISFIVLALGLAAHKFPGFDSYLVVRKLQLHEEAPLTAIRFHFDKAVIGIFFLAFCVTLIRGAREWFSTIQQTIVIVAGSIAGAFVIARLAGFVSFDPVFTSLFFAFLFANLLVTSVAEEAIFRGWIQRGLARRWSQRTYGNYMAIAVASVLFGAAHLWGGPWLFLGATLAGFGYGYAYMKTQRIEAAIIAHFAFNGIHFTFFTYPYWTPAVAS